MPQKNLSAYHPFANRPWLAAGMLVVLYLLSACTPPGNAPAAPAAPGAHAASPTTRAEIGLCSLGDLSASMDWQRSNGALSARLVLANFSDQPCSVQGAPQIELVNENGWKLPVEQVHNATEAVPARVVLDPATAYTAEARFVWRNWCTAATQENLYLDIVLPGYPGNLSVPVQDPNGHFLTDMPRCDDPSAPSTLTIEAFRPGKQVKLGS